MTLKFIYKYINYDVSILVRGVGFGRLFCDRKEEDESECLIVGSFLCLKGENRGYGY